MSSDDELYAQDTRRRSLASPVPPSAGGYGVPDSPRFDNGGGEADRRTSVNETGGGSTANEIANSDERVREVLYSDIGLSVLLNRLKQDVATCKELAGILKKRAVIEDEHGRSLQKLARSTQDTLKRQEIKQQGFNRQFFQAIRSWDDSSASSITFASQLHLMVDEITELAKVIDKKRKGLKHEALRDETNVTAAESVAEKARIKYESLGADLERAISASRGETYPTQKGRFGMSRKSGAQLIKHEEELRGKVGEADRDMQSKHQAAAEVRRDLMNSQRPRNVKNLVDLVTETDTGLSFHLQKFAVLTETLAVSHGSAIMPMNPSRLGFSALIEQINDGRDFRDYVLSFSQKVPKPNRYSGPPNPPTNFESPVPPATSSGAFGGRIPAPQLPEVDSSVNRGEINQDVQRAGGPNGSTPYLPPMNFQSISAPQSQTPVASSSNQPPITYPSAQPPATYQSPTPPPSMIKQPQGYPPDQMSSNYASPNISAPYPSSSSIQTTPASAFIPQSNFGSSTPPIEKSATPPIAQLDRPSTSGQQSIKAPSYKPVTPKGHTFGVPIDEVISRENATLPLIIAQCIIAVDQFGLQTEGIYRVSGSVTTLGKLKHLFDFEPEHIDFRTPAGFFGDIHAVAGILKQYLRELPDPLLTRSYYQDFIRVASIEPDFHRRDAVHSLINDLPDANYSCIRTLALHLHKISQNADHNKMTVQNLANIFGPTLLGSDTSGSEDTRAQIRVTETIISYALDMFELEEE